MYFPHATGIVIGERAVIGNNCKIYHDVTIGARFDGDDYPIIGDGVTIFAGAKIIGPVSIGDKSIIGANAVVIKDIPSGVSVGGIPAQILNRIDDV